MLRGRMHVPKHGCSDLQPSPAPMDRRRHAHQPDSCAVSNLPAAMQFLEGSQPILGMPLLLQKHRRGFCINSFCQLYGRVWYINQGDFTDDADWYFRSIFSPELHASFSGFVLHDFGVVVLFSSRHRYITRSGIKGHQPHGQVRKRRSTLSKPSCTRSFRVRRRREGDAANPTANRYPGQIWFSTCGYIIFTPHPRMCAASRNILRIKLLKNETVALSCSHPFRSHRRKYAQCNAPINVSAFRRPRVYTSSTGAMQLQPCRISQRLNGVTLPARIPRPLSCT